MSIAATIASAYREARRIAPATVTFGGTSYSMALGDVSKARDRELGGYMPDYETTLVCLLSDYDTVPTIGDKITYGGQVYRVTREDTDPQGVTRSLYMVAEEG